MDLVKLIEVWLTECNLYVELDGKSLEIFDSKDGTIQGSVLGPILFAIFVSPLFDISSWTNFATDNFVLEFNTQVDTLIVDMQRKLEMITKWLKDSDLKVNETKTKLCLFPWNDARKVTINLNGDLIIKKSMGVLGIIFYLILTWSDQASNSI
jgi:hypothetical protein